MEIYDNNSKLDDSKLKYVLTKNTAEYLSQSNDVVNKFITILRERHDLINKVIQNCVTGDQKSCVASLLTNNFYENVFSSSFIENELLIVLYLSLKNEISGLTQQNIPQAFLKESFNSFLFRGLLRKDDVKSYFGIVLKDVIEKMENKEDSNMELNFELNRILNDIAKKKNEENEKTKGKLKRKTQLEQKSARGSKTYGICLTEPSMTSFSFGQSYVLTEGSTPNTTFDKYKADLSKAELIEMINKEKDEKMIKYLNNQLLQYENDEGIYQNQTFLSNVYKCNNSEEVYEIYKTNYNIITELLDLLYDNFLSNVHIIPYSIKCVCKMISILIKKKFPNISLLEHNNFISEFFFEKILKPIFTIPDYNGLISSVIVSNVTKKNIILLQKILKQLINGKFYKANTQPDFTFFNRFFIHMMPKVFSFFENLTDVQLPSILQKLINNKIDENNFVYDYFEENPNEKVTHISMCFTIDDIITIFKIIQNNEKEFLDITPTSKNNDKIDRFNRSQRIFKLTYNKLKNTSIYMDILTRNKTDDLVNKRKTFMLLTSIKFNNKLKKIMDISLKNQNFTLSLPKPPKDDTEGGTVVEIDDKKKNLILVKNYICKILFNFKDLSEDIFLSNSIKSTEEIFNSIQIFLQTDYYLLLYSIPLDWYGMSLLSLLHEIPQEYIDNDYAKLYDELTKEVLDAIQILNISTLSGIKTKLKYTNRAIKNVLDCLNKLKNIELNNKIQKFIDHSKIEVYVNVQQTKIGGSLKISKKEENVKTRFGIFDNLIFEKSDSKGQLCNTIYDFIKYFPNFVSYQKKHNLEIGSLIKTYKAADAVNDFLSIVESNVKTYPCFKKLTSKEMEYIKFEINNYLMGRIYVKVFPKDPDTEDLKINNKCVLLSWIEPHHLIPNKNIILNNFVADTTRYINKMQMEKSPIKKIEAMLKVSEIIQSTIVFSTGNNESGVDDALPFLEYAVIKAAPNYLYSNVNYLENFLDPSLKKAKYGMILTQLHLIVEAIANFECKNLIGVTPEEYIEYSKEAAQKFTSRISFK